jgi:hypothetical protein
MKKSRLIVVLGMHRSGTSATTRGLKVLGVELGDRMMPAAEGNNAKGFWEDIDLNALNIQMLKAVGCDWQNPALLSVDDLEELCNQGFLLRAVELLRSKLGQGTPFAFKDPRVAKLLPFWKRVFDRCQLDVGYVLPVRHPRSVFKSLLSRDGMGAEQAYLLWLGHVIGSLAGSTGAKRVLLDFDRLMEAPERELRRIAKQFNLKTDPTELQNYKTKYLDQGLRHTVYTLQDLAIDDACPPLVREVYDELLKVASDKVDLNDVELANKIDQWAMRFESITAADDTLYARIRRINQLAVARDAQIAGLAQAVHDKDIHIVNLNQIVSERDAQIFNLNHVVSERDGQIFNFNQVVSERDGQIFNLNQVVAERDGQVFNLNQVVSERDGQIFNLNQVVAERDGQVFNLNQVVSERDGQIFNLNQVVAERDGQVFNLNQVVSKRDGQL